MVRRSYNRVDLAGQRFERLVVVKDIGNHPTTGESYWKCLCDCGKTTYVTGYCLTSGNTKSCGCYHKIRTRQLFSKSDAEIRVNRVLFDYRKRAKQKGLEFKLTLEQFSNLLGSDCHYCGAPPKNSIVQHGKRLDVYQGIDRLDNSKGYTLDNVVPCCIVCNKMKKAMDAETFVNHVHTISVRHECVSPQADFHYEVCGACVL